MNSASFEAEFISSFEAESCLCVTVAFPLKVLVRIKNDHSLMIFRIIYLETKQWNWDLWLLSADQSFGG